MPDPHSYADDAQPKTKHFDVALSADFDARELAGTVTLTLDGPAGGALDLDTRGLAIQSVTGPDGAALPFELSPPDKIKGSRLRIATTSDSVTIRYRTAADAVALQWLTPSQTKGGAHPYVFTQCQPIHARTILPCQDSPRVRSQYRAKLDIPSTLRAVMAAAHVGRTELGRGRALETFEMPQPIPSYLFAFAIGNIHGKDIGARSRVYTEPELLEAAAWEMESVDRMLEAAERLFGPYSWDRFDLLVMPPSFPYGGMENPRLTFLTPTLLAGDRSLVNVVGHELAHSWTGNYVTNATMNDFWLNEGFTVYAERRILEVLEGNDALALHASLGRKHLDVDMARLEKVDPKLTRLRTDLSGIHPDDVYSLVPYEKGYLFLRLLEELAGRERFDRFLRGYIQEFAFRSITTDDFLRHLRAHLADIAARVNLSEWIDGAGIPSSAPKVRSAHLERIQALVTEWTGGKRPDGAALAQLGANEWQVFLSSLPKEQTRENCAFLSQHIGARMKNAEIRVAFLTIAAASNYTPAHADIRETLLAWGRMKYLRPIYTALVDQGPEGQQLAREVYAQAKPGYHPVAQSVVESVLAKVS